MIVSDNGKTNKAFNDWNAPFSAQILIFLTKPPGSTRDHKQSKISISPSKPTSEKQNDSGLTHFIYS